jgi:hypothetical protein
MAVPDLDDGFSVSVQSELVVDLQDARDRAGDLVGLAAINLCVDKALEVHHLTDGPDNDMVNGFPSTRRR